MRHLTVLTVLTVALSVNLLARAVASEPITSNIIFVTDAESCYGSGNNFDENYTDIGGYIGTEALKGCITFVLNGETCTVKGGCYIGTDIVRPKFAAGGYGCLTGLGKGVLCSATRMGMIPIRLGLG